MRIYILGFFAFFANISFGQWNKVAKPYQDKMDYYAAAKAYSKVLDTGNIQDFVTYTRVLFNQGQFSKSYENYLILSRKNLLKEHYDLEAFRTCLFVLGIPGAERFDVEYKEVLKKLNVMGYINELSTDNTEYSIQTACFNSREFEDLCPVGFEDGVLFTSSRTSVNGELGNYGYNDQPYYDVFFANGCNVQDIKGKLAKKLPSNINTTLHDGPVYISTTSGLFFITRNIENPNGTMPMGIFYSAKLDKGWSKFSALPLNNVNYTIQHPYFNDSTKTLYFSSNMTGGFGGFDLYSIKYLGNGSWAEPINLGPNVNTDLNEVFPSMYKNKLYFSSNGIKGKGGYDIFQFDKNRLIQIPSLNSQWDDYGIYFLNDSIGYLSSNRVNGFAKDDIMRFALLKPSNVIYVEALANNLNKSWGNPVKTMISYNVVDSISGETLNNPKISMTILNKTSGIISNFSVTGDSVKIILGHFANDSIFDVSLSLNQPGFDPVLKHFDGVKSNDLGMLNLGAINLSRNKFYRPNHKYPYLKPIYFDLDKFTIRKDAANTLDSAVLMLKAFPNVKLELKAFTDSRATDNYNKQLSEKRAKATFKYLVKHGIKANRLIYAGYGEAGLVNDCGNDKECEEKMHQLNRRTELKMID